MSTFNTASAASLSLALAWSVSGCGGAGSAADTDLTTEQTASRFSTAPQEPNHEDITAAALDFLRADMLTALTVANVSTDVEFALVNANHFDDCNFSGGSAVVASNQTDAVNSLDPSLPVDADASAILSFGRSLHAVQDFYAHSNWVELGGQALVDASLTEFPALSGYTKIPSSGFVVVQGAKPRKLKVSIQRDAEAPYPESAVVTVKLDRRRAPGLISGTVDYEPGDECPNPASMLHADLNKDKSTIAGREEQHARAKALAISQTRHEWCRLVALTRAAWGEAGVARLEGWVAEGAAEPDCTTE